MNIAMIMGIIRHLLTLVGGYFISHMKMDPETIQAVIGAIITLIGWGWSIYTKVPTSELNNLDSEKPKQRRNEFVGRKREPYAGETFDIKPVENYPLNIPPIPHGIKPTPTATNSGM
jgi:hypothetical protein